MSAGTKPGTLLVIALVLGLGAPAATANSAAVVAVDFNRDCNSFEASSTRDIGTIEIDYVDGTSQELDGRTGHIFGHEGKETISQVRVKSGTTEAAFGCSFPSRVIPNSLGVGAQNVLYPENVGVSRADAPAYWRAHLDAIAEQGIELVRASILWNLVEPQAPNPITGERAYYWTAQPNGFGYDYDAFVADLAVRGLRWTVTLHGSTSWARAGGEHTTAPLFARFPDFAAFAAAVSARYGPDGQFWDENPHLPRVPLRIFDIWNEPNLSWRERCLTHMPGVDLAPGDYANFFSQVRRAILRVDPGATVMLGGIGDIELRTDQVDTRCTAREWIQGIEAFRPGLIGSAGYVGLHVYSALPEGVLHRISLFRDVLDHDVNAPEALIWLNENGWRVIGDQEGPGDATTEENRAIRLPQTADMVIRSNCGMRNYTAHTWLTPAQDPTGFHLGYGIAERELDADGKAVLTPTALAFGREVRILQGQGPVAPDPGVVDGCPWRG